MSISISLEDIIQSIKPITDLNSLITNSSVYEKIKETADQVESLYCSRSDSEDLLTLLEEFKKKNSEQQLNVADIDTSEDNDLEYDMQNIKIRQKN